MLRRFLKKIKKRCALNRIYKREKVALEWTSQFPEELLVRALCDTPCERRIVLHQLGLDGQEDDVIIRERKGIFFYFRRKRE